MPLLLLHCFLLFLLQSSSSSSVVDHCDLRSSPDPLTLRSDQLTVLISGYSESRIPLLSSLALSYSSHPLVAAVLILWFNPSTPSSLLRPLSLLSSSSISLHLHNSTSLSSRFLPRGPHIPTRSVLICDDDVESPPASLSFAFRIARSNPDRLVGFFARSHQFDLASKSWIYTVHPDRYSIVLTKFLILKTEYLQRFSCSERLGKAREYVERKRNCEDLLMNFVAAMESGEGPVLVEASGVRDWGDPRNDDDSNSAAAAAAGALSARGDHRKRRGECIGEFHRLLGEMPLRYSYGKIVEGVGEQGLCQKSGKLVYCDA